MNEELIKGLARLLSNPSVAGRRIVTWYDEDGDVWYWNGYENEFISYGSDGYIDDDTGEYMESNDAGWDYSDEYYDDYDPWSDPGDGWGDYTEDDGWGDYF